MIGPQVAAAPGAKARLQRDRVSGKPFLLYPERGLELIGQRRAHRRSVR